MNPNKDYYAILGLTPSADDVVVRAAYKALAQRYHPDRTKEPPDIATARMAEINEAYNVLRDPKTRREYDELRGSGTQSGDTAFGENAEPPSSVSPLEDDWRTAVEFFPEIDTTYRQLQNISWRLAEAFRATILESKNFKGAKFVARKLENEFLKVYFGENEAILVFARMLIAGGHKSAARDLNKAVRVLGEIEEASRIIGKVRKKYGLGQNRVYYGQREGVRASDYAVDAGLSEAVVLEALRSGDVEGFILEGEWYVEVDDLGNGVTRSQKMRQAAGKDVPKGCLSIIVVPIGVLTVWYLSYITSVG